MIGGLPTVDINWTLKQWKILYELSKSRNLCFFVFWFPRRFLQVVDRKPGIPLEKCISYRKTKKTRENQQKQKKQRFSRLWGYELNNLESDLLVFLVLEKQDNYHQEMPSRGSGRGSPQERLQNKVIIIRKCLPEALGEGPPRKGSRTR